MQVTALRNARLRDDVRRDPDALQQLAPPPRRKQPRNKRRVRGLSSPLDSSHVTVAGVAGPTPTRALRSARQRESERDARNNTRRGSGVCVRGSL
ncbi:phytoene dehydrogenase [Pycnococcus provasolii]